MSDKIVSQGIVNGYRWTKQDCPTCQIEPTKFIGKRGGQSHREGLGIETDVWECGKCGLIFPNPMPYPAAGLGQHYHVDADEYFQIHDREERIEGAKELLRQAEKLLGRKGRLLDVGVGRGEMLIAARELGWESEGVEPSQTFAEYAERQTGAKIWREPIEDSDISDEQFDAVMLSAVLEHLYNPNAVIGKISRILKPGGLLFLDVPNEKGLYFRVGNLYQQIRGRKWCVNLAPTFSPFHVFGFSPRSLRTLLTKHGLEPAMWKVYAGRSVISGRTGFVGAIEAAASKLIIFISNFGQTGAYIETWAVKK